MSYDTKKCPMCAEEIKAEALLCRFCGTRFDSDDQPLQPETAPPATFSMPAAYTPPAEVSFQPPKQKSAWKRVLIALAVLIGLCLLLLIGMNSLLANVANQISTPNTPGPTKTLRLTYTSRPSFTPRPTSTPTLTPTPTPLPVGAAYANPSGELGIACFSSGSYGLTCLDESGWHTFTEDNSNLKGNVIYEFALCPDGTVLIGHQDGISLWDGKNWLSHYNPSSFGYSVYAIAVACSTTGAKGFAHREGISYFDGSRWVDIEPEKITAALDPEILKDCVYDCLTDIAITPDGKIWVLAKGALVQFDGNTWTPVEAPGTFNKIAVDPNGHIWAVSEDKLYHFIEETWDEFEYAFEGDLRDLLIDQDNRVWVSTDGGQVLVFDEGNWLAYDVTDGGKISDSINHLALDGRGRLWVGSAWGLNVFDGEKWTAYHMHTADFVNFSIGSIVVLAGGPELPPPVEKEPGVVTGKILIAGQPASRKKVEVCQYHMGFMIWYSTTPCSGKPLRHTATTDSNGVFRIENLPPGYYSLFYSPKEKDWDYSQGFLLQPGQELVLKDINLEE